jgi:hypothetical protein
MPWLVVLVLAMLAVPTPAPGQEPTTEDDNALYAFGFSRAER